MPTRDASVPNRCHRARDARGSAEAAAGGKAADGHTVRTESPRARAESRRDRRHPAHHSRWHLREAWEHHDRKRFRVRGGLSLASSLRLRRRPRRVGRRLTQGYGQGRHAFGFQILAAADFWRRATAGAPSIHRKITLVSVRTRFGPRRPTFSCALRRLARERLCAWLPSSRSVAASSTTSPG